jgi:hypothetical protein
MVPSPPAGSDPRRSPGRTVPAPRDIWHALRGGLSVPEIEELERRDRIIIDHTMESAIRVTVAMVMEDLEEGRSSDPLEHVILADVGDDRLEQVNREMRRWLNIPAADPAQETMRLCAGDVVVATRDVTPVGEQIALPAGMAGVIGYREQSDPPGMPVRLGGHRVLVEARDVDALQLGYARPFARARDGMAERVYVVADKRFDGLDHAPTPGREACVVVVASASLDTNSHDAEAGAGSSAAAKLPPPSRPSTLRM